MKHLSILPVILFLATQLATAQDSLPKPRHQSTTIIRDHDYYEQQSKTLIPVGYVLIGAGAVATIVGTITFTNSYDIIDACGGCFVTAAIGIAAISVGIPLLVKGYVFKRKANMTLKSENLNHASHVPVKANLISAGIAISL